jgi:divalent metal cation (Fe/Co/Zn/Cd) transporter
LRASRPSENTISLDITHDGFSNLRRAVVDLMDQTPTTIDQDNVDPLRDKLTSMLQDLDWVNEAEVRLREEGQVYFGEAFVVPSDETDITENIEGALEQARDLDWRIYDLALMPVRELPEKVDRQRRKNREVSALVVGSVTPMRASLNRCTASMMRHAPPRSRR